MIVEVLGEFGIVWDWVKVIIFVVVIGRIFSSLTHI